MSLKEKIKSYYTNNREEFALMICGFLMLNGNVNTYKLYEAIK
jgi:hypothetical protein